MSRILKCKTCYFENPQGSVYCQHCGSELKKSLFAPKSKSRDNKIFLAGMGNKGSSLAPLAGMAIENQAADFPEYKKGKTFPKIPIFPLEDGTWHCPLCGDKNRTAICKGCGFSKNS